MKFELDYSKVSYVIKQQSSFLLNVQMKRKEIHFHR